MYMMKKEFEITKFLAWLITGLVISLSAVAMIFSGHVNLGRFYDVGEIYDVPLQTMYAEVSNISYDQQKGIHDIDAEEASYTFTIKDQSTKWKYLYLEMKNLSVDDLTVTLQCSNKKGEPLYTEQYSLKNGGNFLPVPTISLYQCSLQFHNQKGVAFNLNQNRLLEKEPVYSTMKAIQWLLIAFLGYFLLTLVWKAVRRKRRKWDWYHLIAGVQKFYAQVGRKLVPKVVMEMNPKVKDVVRTLLFAIAVAYIYITYLIGQYAKYTRYHMLVISAILLLIAIFSVEGKLHKVNWRNPLVASWFTFWIFVILSDFLVRKQIAYVGWVMILVFGFFAFVWNNMKRPSRLLQNMLDAIEILFWLNTLICVLFRPYTDGIRYTGTEKNPGMYAMSLMMVTVMFAGKMEDRIAKGNLGLPFVRQVGGLTISLYMIWLTQSVTSLGALAFLAILFLFRVTLLLKSKRNRALKKGVAITIVCAIIFSMSFAWLVRNVSPSLHLQYKYTDEVEQAQVPIHLLTMEVQAANVQPRIIRKLFHAGNLENITSERNLYWMAYLRDMNLLGHTSKAFFWGGTHHAHNAFLTIAYAYGVFAVVPYILMIFWSIVYAGRRIRMKLEEKQYNVVPFGMMVGTFLIAMGDNVEQPFGTIPWLMLYLIMLLLFDSNKISNMNGL